MIVEVIRGGIVVHALGMEERPLVPGLSMYWTENEGGFQPQDGDLLRLPAGVESIELTVTASAGQ